MSSHRPKSLSELNNVYDKALRAEKAIKESSSLLSTPETSEAKPSENIFQQLETKAAEAKKNQVFDPDISNIASDFLKRYAQPEKPKAAPKEIKRPAPTIQSVQPHVRKPKVEIKAEDTLNQSTVAPSEIKVPVHRPSHDVPATDAFVTAPQTIVSAEPSIPAYAEPVQAEEPVVEVPVAPAPVVEAPAVRQTPARTAHAPKIDHTPRPNRRVRITSSERSELMEEYMRVMSDEDDEPSEKKSVFSFFRKKKQDDYDDEPVESIYEDFSEEEPATDDEVPVVAFDSSNVKYEDEYSDAPLQEETDVASSPMNLYDYIEADFDYDEDDDEDGTLDISTTTFEKEDVAADEFYGTEEPVSEAEADEIAETEVYPAEEASEEIPEEVIAEPIEEIIEPEVIEEAEIIEEAVVYEEPAEATEIVETEEIAEVQEEIQEIEEAEEIVPAEEYYEEENDTAEATEEYAPPAEMVFEDIFSVSDESKRSHSGGDWGGSVPPEALASYESDEAYDEEVDVYDGYDDYDDEDYDDEDYDDEPSEKKKGNIFVKILLVFFALISLTLGATTVAADFVLDIDSGKLISDTYRLFCAREDMPSFDIDKGDLIVAKNTHVDKDNIYVYATDDDAYGVGKVIENTDNALGEFLLSTETVDGNQLIKRDSSMGVVVASYSILGTILSIVCNFGIFIAIAFVLIAIGLIVLLVIISKKKSSRYVEENSSENDDDDNEYYDDGDDSEEYEDDEEYYSEYDTDGIEQGLFTNI